MAPIGAIEEAQFDVTKLSGTEQLPLAGTWLFHREQLLDGTKAHAQGSKVAVPADWQVYPGGKAQQFGTFELVLRTKPATTYHLHIPRIFSAVRILLDARVVYESGRVGNDAGSHLPAITNGHVQFTAREPLTRIFFQVSNFSLPYGGIFYAPGISLSSAGEGDPEHLLEFGLVLLLLAGSFYHGMLQLSWKRDRSHLFFSCALLSIAVRTAFSGHDVANLLFPTLSWSLHYRLEFSGLYLTVLAMYAFAYEIVGVGNQRWLRWVGVVAGLLLLIPVLALPVGTFTALLLVFQGYTVFVLAIVGYLVVRAVRAKIRFWLWYLGASVLFAAVAANDIIAAQFGVRTGYVTKDAFLVFILVQSGILNAVFLEAFRKAERINKTLRNEIALSESELVESHRQNETLLKAVIADVEEARRLQESLLPKEFPLVQNLRVYGRYLPMDLVGGDMYAFARHADGRFGCLIADVSGHGIAAATVAASTRLLYSICTQITSSPSQILQLLNERLPDHIGRHFLTAVCVVFDSAARKLVMSNAGHPPMLVISAGKASRHNARGTVLGAFRELHFEELELQLKPGDRVALFTDGLVEEKEAEEYEIGVQRLSDLLAKGTALPLRQWVDHAVDQATARSGIHNLPDDITMVAFEVT